MQVSIGDTVCFKPDWTESALEGVVKDYVITADTYMVSAEGVIWPVSYSEILWVKRVNHVDTTAPVETKQPEQEAEPEKTEQERLKEFFFGKPAELTEWQKTWKSEGRCPMCGELGTIRLSTFVCSEHGPY